MLRRPIAAGLITFTLAVVPVMAQTPAPGPTPPTPQQPGVAGGGGGSPAQTTAPGTESSQGKVIGTPKEPSSTDAQRGASLVPLSYIGLIALGAAAAVWFVWHRRRRRG
jgi:hypothetical protein